MFYRYNVYEGDKLIAVIHAENAKRAIQAACRKTDGHNPMKCTAGLVTAKPGNGPGASPVLPLRDNRSPTYSDLRERNGEQSEFSSKCSVQD